MYKLLKVHNDFTLSIQDANDSLISTKFSFAHLKFPVLNNENPSKDEKGAFEAREFLKRRFKDKKFKITNEGCASHTNQKIMKLGKLILEDKDIALEIIERGFAQPNDQGQKENQTFLKYKAHFEALNKKGEIPKFKPRDFTLLNSELPLETCLLNVKLSAIVESIVNLSTYQVYIPSKNVILHISSNIIEVPEIGEAFAGKVNTVLNNRLLQETIEIVITDFEDSDDFGRLALCQINTNDKGSLEETLLKLGMAAIKSAAYYLLPPSTILNYELLLSNAKDEKIGVWYNYIDYMTLIRSKDNYSGIITEVIKGDTIKVYDASSNKAVTIKIANIEVPSGENFFSFEAREYVRKNFIGTFVNCIITGALKSNQTAYDIYEATVYLENGKTLAHLILLQGLGTLIKLKGNDAKDIAIFQDFIKAEAEAKERNMGIHSIKLPVVPYFTNILENKNVIKAQEVLTSYRNNPTLGRLLSAVIEKINTGSSYEIRVDALAVQINFYLAGVISIAEQNCLIELKPYGALAYSVAYETLMHRDVKIQIIGLNKNGSFFGNVYINQENFSAKLLSLGLAYTITVPDKPNYWKSVEYDNLEIEAQETKQGLWSTGINVFEEKIQHFNTYNEGERYEVIVTEVLDSKSIYVQIPNSEDLYFIEEEIKDIVLSKTLEKLNPADIDPGKTFCLAQFSENLEWFRAKIKAIKKAENNQKQYEVFYLDYGNSELLAIDKLCRIPANLLEMNPLATKIALAGIRMPPIDHTVGEEAHEYLTELLFDIKLEMYVIKVLDKYMEVHLNLLKGSNISKMILENGFARIDKKFYSINNFPDWVRAEKKAKIDEIGIWHCDDQLSGSESDEENKNDLHYF